MNGADAEGPIGGVRIPGTEEGDRSVSGRTSPTAESRSIGHLHLFFLPLLLFILGDQTSQPGRLRCDLPSGLPNPYFFVHCDKIPLFAVFRSYWPRNEMDIDEFITVILKL